MPAAILTYPSTNRLRAAQAVANAAVARLHQRAIAELERRRAEPELSGPAGRAELDEIETRLERLLARATDPDLRGAAGPATNAGEGGREHPSSPVPLPRRGARPGPAEAPFQRALREGRVGFYVTGLPLLRREDGGLVVVQPGGDR